MKKIRVILIVLFGIILLTGCKMNKKSVDSTEFKSRMDKQSIAMMDVTDLYGISKKAYQTDKTEYKIIYVEGKRESDIKAMFIDEAKNVYSKANIIDEANNGTTEANKYTKNTSSGNNWSAVEITTDVNYYYLTYIDNVLLYIEGNIDQKDTLIKVRDAVEQ